MREAAQKKCSWNKSQEWRRQSPGARQITHGLPGLVQTECPFYFFCFAASIASGFCGLANAGTWQINRTVCNRHCILGSCQRLLVGSNTACKNAGARYDGPQRFFVVACNRKAFCWPPDPPHLSYRVTRVSCFHPAHNPAPSSGIG